MDGQVIERRTMRLVGRRLLPFLFILFVLNFLDRTNVGIAALQMNDELKFSPAVFGFGAGIFFLGYALFEVPSNLVLARVGARRWLARIMITWGIIASAMMFVRTPLQFYILRFLLGVAEAGFFPGVIYYLSFWFPAAYRARATSRFTVAIPIAQAVSGALGGSLLGLTGIGHLSGWQWLFLLEGLPSVLLGIVALVYLTDRPKDARWLPPAEQAWLSDRLERDQSESLAVAFNSLQAMIKPLTWALALTYFAYYTVALAYVVWAPLLVREALGTGNTVTGFVTASIAVLQTVVYLSAATRSDKRDDRCRFAAIGLGVMLAGCMGAAFAPTAPIRILSLAMIPLGSAVFLPSFWCLPSMLFRGTGAAAAIALISAIGSTGGFVGPSLIGLLKRTTGGDMGAFLTLAGIGALGCICCLRMQRLAALRGRSISMSSDQTPLTH